MRLKDMKIGTKLTGSFVIILLLMTAIGIFCIKSIRDIETANGEIQDITLAELNLARGRQDSLRLIYTGEEQYGEAARSYLTAARGWVGKMLERNGAARIYSGEAEENGRELDRALADYLDALVVIEGTNGAMKESSRAGEAAARQVDLVFSGLESFVVEVTDGAFSRGEDELGRLLLTQNLVHIYDMTGLWDRTAGIMGAYEKNATVENRDALLSHLEEIVARFDRADVIFTTEEGRRAIRDVRVPFGVYRSQAQAFIDASEAQTAAISRAVDAGAATAASADRASQVLQAIVGETTEKAVRYTLILSLAALVISLVLALVITRRITGPILRSMAYAQSLSEGDFSVTLGLDQADEVGTLGAALEDMVDRVRRVLHHIQNSSRQVTGASGQISQSAQTISVGASEQASSMEEVSSSLEELSSNIQQNAANAQRSNEAADLIKRDTSHGVEAVRETVRAMKDIGEKIGVIEDLARNTNMLALNAAIEAARAGEAGKGFAVVASEVRKLAENSGNAAKVITEITRENVKKAESALEKIEAVIPVIGQSAELSDEIALGSEEQAKGAEQINSAVSALDQVVQQNASASEELASMAEELEAQARSMNEAVSFFRLGEERRAAREDRVEIGPLPGESPASERRKLLSDGTDGDFEEF